MRAGARAGGRRRRSDRRGRRVGRHRSPGDQRRGGDRARACRSWSGSRPSDVPVSVDTCKAGGRPRGGGAGAAMVNDVSGLLRPGARRRLRGEPARRSVIMHTRVAPEGEDRYPHYDDVAADVRAFLRRAHGAGARARRDRGADRARPGPRLRQDPGADRAACCARSGSCWRSAAPILLGGVAQGLRRRADRAARRASASPARWPRWRRRRRGQPRSCACTTSRRPRDFLDRAGGATRRARAGRG